MGVRRRMESLISKAYDAWRLSPTNDNLRAVDELARKYRKIHGKNPLGFAGIGWDEVYMALKRRTKGAV